MISSFKKLLCLISLFSLLLGCDAPESGIPIASKKESSLTTVTNISIPMAKEWFYKEYVKEQNGEATVDSNEFTREIFGIGQLWAKCLTARI